MNRKKLLRELEGDLRLRGVWTVEHWRDGKVIHEQQGKNLITTVGLNHILDVVLGSTSKSATWYCGIFKGNITPVSGDTAGVCLGAVGTYTECQDADYTPATNRPTYVPASAAAGIITNSASKAQYNIAQSITVYGAFLVDSQAKTSTSGTLISAKRFDVSRAVINGDILYVTYQITSSSA